MGATNNRGKGTGELEAHRNESGRGTDIELLGEHGKVLEKCRETCRESEIGIMLTELQETDIDNDGWSSLIHLSLATHEPAQDRVTNASF